MISLRKIDGYELLTQKVYKVLKEAILNGDLPQGSRLVETKLARQLGVSRTPVREAIHRLSVEGFVRLIPNQGAFVAEISLEDIEEVFQIRGVLEGLAVRLFVKSKDEEEVKELEEKIEEMRCAVEGKDIIAYSDADAEFHRLIWLFSGNERLLKVLDGMVSYIDAYRLKSLYIPGVMETSFQDHIEIVELVKQGDAKKAEEVMRRHVDTVLEKILEAGRC